MATLKQLIERRAFLERKLDFLERLKGWVEQGDDKLSDEVLLDVDAQLVAPVLEEIKRLDGLEVEDGEEKGKGRKAKGKPKARTRARKGS